MFHDEPTIESLDLMGLDVASVGNHEFDEGKDELLRMQNGGCHPKDGCQGPHPFLGAKFRYLAASTIEKSTGKPLLPAYEIRNFDGIPVAFIGLTLKGTPLIVAPDGVATPRIPRRGRDGECADPGTEGARRRGDRGADPRGRASDRRLQRMPRHLRPDRRHRQKVRQGGRHRGHRPHPPRLCLRDRRPARHLAPTNTARSSPPSTSSSIPSRATSSAPRPTTPSFASHRSPRPRSRPR